MGKVGEGGGEEWGMNSILSNPLRTEIFFWEVKHFRRIVKFLSLIDYATRLKYHFCPQNL